MASEEEYVYAIVLFLPRKNRNNLVDLIPCSWISTDENGVSCKYPDPEEYSKLPHWVASLHTPNKNVLMWKYFPMHVSKYML